jgi:ribosomal 50S subunit-recycling heat shock protein
MRLDKFLVVSRLVKQRTRAKELCDAGHVKIGGHSAKASRGVKVDEVIELTLPNRLLAVRVRAVPTSKSVPKAEAPTLYEVVTDERTGPLK